MVMLTGVSHTEVNADLIQERRRRQLDTFGRKVLCHFKQQAISAAGQAGVIVQEPVRISPVRIEREAFDQCDQRRVRRQQVNPHTGRWATMHRVENVCA